MASVETMCKVMGFGGGGHMIPLHLQGGYTSDNRYIGRAGGSGLGSYVEKGGKFIKGIICFSPTLTLVLSMRTIVI